MNNVLNGAKLSGQHFFQGKFHCILLIANLVVEFCSCLKKRKRKEKLGMFSLGMFFLGMFCGRYNY